MGVYIPLVTQLLLNALFLDPARSAPRDPARDHAARRDLLRGADLQPVTTIGKRQVVARAARHADFLIAVTDGVDSEAPNPLARRAPRRMRPISFGIPEHLVLDEVPPKTKDFPAHIVDVEVAEHVDAATSYAFADAAHGLDAANAIAYADASDLMGRLENLSAADESELQHAAVRWAADNTTHAVAGRFLRALGYRV
jgi:hypothetical protein